MTDPDGPAPNPAPNPNAGAAAAAGDAALAAPRRPARTRRPDPGKRGAAGWAAWLADPRGMVLIALGSALVVGGGRRWLQVARARRVVADLGLPRPSLGAIRAAADHGRAGLMDLFRLLGTSDRPNVREAAGRSLARLWYRDDLIVEEEKALVRRGFDVTWHARRRYPRGLRAPIPITVAYGVPFLRDEPGEVGPHALAWSHRITGAERVGLEQPTPLTPGPGRAAFAIDPDDFPTDGPHQLVLHARVRATGPTSAWDLDLPQMPFRFEFDPRLAVDALLAPADDAEAAKIRAAVRLEPEPGDDDPTGPPRWLEVGPGLVLRDPPALVVTGPIPRDLAHTLAVEFEGVPGRFRAGSVVVRAEELGSGTARIPLGPLMGVPPDTFDRPGPVQLRATLTPDGDLGWADPAVRSLWPGELTTDATAGRIVRV